METSVAPPEKLPDGSVSLSDPLFSSLRTASAARARTAATVSRSSDSMCFSIYFSGSS